MSLSRDTIVGALILCLCALLWYVTTTFETDPLGMVGGMPATHMPRILLGLIASLSTLLIVQGLISGGDQLGPLPPWQVWATAALLGGIAVIFPTIGVPIAFFVVCTALPLLWGARNLIGITIFALAVPTAIYLIFRVLLGLRLPMGPLSAFGL